MPRLLRIGSAKTLTLGSELGQTPEPQDVTQRYTVG